MFGSGSVYSNQKSKPNRNFQFLKINNQTEPKLNWNFYNGSVGFGRFFHFISFMHTPSSNEKKKKDEIGGSRKLGIGPVLTVGVERRNDRGKEQELREKK